MAEDLRTTIASYWHQIEQVSQVSFNHNYWQLNTPYRSTYIACRAVIIADKYVADGAQRMVKAIQSAYYQAAKNPSLESTLADCANTIGLDREIFIKALSSQEIEQQLQQHLAISRQLNVTGFPALFS